MRCALSTQDALAGLTLVRDKLDGYQRADDFYGDGVGGEVFFEPRLERVLGGRAREFLFNIARPPVTAVLDRLLISRVECTDEDAADVIAEVAADNDMPLVEDLAHEHAASRGDSYLLVWPDGDGGYAITVESAHNCCVVYDPEYPQRAAFAVKTWQEQLPGEKDPRVRVNVYYPDWVEKWVTKRDAQDSPGDPLKASDFEPWVDTFRAAGDGDRVDVGDGDSRAAEPGELVEVWPVPNPYRTIPLRHLRTGLPYGRPVGKDAWGPQRMVTKITATHPAVIEAAGWPQRVVTQGTLESSEAGDFDEDDGIAGTTSELVGSRLRSTPGGIWELPQDAKWGQFDPANPDAFLKPFETYVGAAAALTDTPHNRFLASGSGQHPSGAAQVEAKEPLNKKAARLQRVMGATWKGVWELVLLMRFVDERVDGADPSSDEWWDRLDAAHDEWDQLVDRPVVTVVWETPDATSDLDRAKAVREWHTAEAISLRERVRARRPDLDDDALEREVVSVEAELDADLPPLTGLSEGVGPPDPSTFTGTE